MVDLIVDAKCIEERTEPMSTSSHVDRWLLPRRQTEFPLRDLLPEATLHARRELTFLALAVLVVLPAAVLVLVGATHTLDLSTLLSSIAPDLDLPVALVLPLGAAPFALSLVAVALACELFGGRRAYALAWAGALSAAALAGGTYLIDEVGGTATSATALAFGAACIVALFAHVVVFDGLRRALHGRHMFTRTVVAALAASALGFAAFGGVTMLVAPNVSDDAILAMAAGCAAWTFALAFVLAIVAAVAARLLSVALRVGRELDVVEPADDLLDDRPAFVRPVNGAPVAAPVVAAPAPAASMPAPTVAASDDDIARTTRPARAMPAVTAAVDLAEGSVSRALPAAEIVDEDVLALEPKPSPRRAARASLQPFSSAEMAFFAEGDELETAH